MWSIPHSASPRPTRGAHPLDLSVLHKLDPNAEAGKWQLWRDSQNGLKTISYTVQQIVPRLAYIASNRIFQFNVFRRNRSNICRIRNDISPSWKVLMASIASGKETLSWINHVVSSKALSFVVSSLNFWINLQLIGLLAAKWIPWILILCSPLSKIVLIKLAKWRNFCKLWSRARRCEEKISVKKFAGTLREKLLGILIELTIIFFTVNMLSWVDFL